MAICDVWQTPDVEMQLVMVMMMMVMLDLWNLGPMEFRQSARSSTAAVENQSGGLYLRLRYPTGKRSSVALW
jgi:hypothetical protein